MSDVISNLPHIGKQVDSSGRGDDLFTEAELLELKRLVNDVMFESNLFSRQLDLLNRISALIKTK